MFFNFMYWIVYNTIINYKTNVPLRLYEKIATYFE